MTAAASPSARPAATALVGRSHRWSLFWSRHWFLRLLTLRLFATLGLILGVTLVAFLLTHLVPGDPVEASLGLKAMAHPAVVAEYRHQYGLDNPLPVQYVVYLSHLIRGDLGTSLLTHRPVSTDLRQFVPATFELGLLASFLTVVIGVPLGLIAATHKDSWVDRLLSVVSLVSISTPPFWIGLLALYLFSFVLGLAPGSGRLSPAVTPPTMVTGMYTVDALLAGDVSTFLDAVHHLILPAVVLAVGGIGILLRFTRSAVLEVLDNQYITAARAKGLPRMRILVRYTLRAALTPVLTLSGVMFAELMTGAVLVESVFNFPGVGLYAARSALSLDLSAITGVCIFVAIVYIATNLVVDILYGVIDPRVRASGR